MKKIRKILLIIIIIVFCIIGMLLANNLINDETKYAKKLDFKNSNELLAIFFLGGLEGEYDYSVVKKYYSDNEMKEFEVIDLDGEECYLIVPRYNQNIQISSLTMTEDGGTKVKIEKEVVKPFFLKCNISDIFPNAEINLEYNGKEYKYSPYISLKDGNVVVEEFVILVNK